MLFDDFINVPERAETVFTLPLTAKETANMYKF